MTGTQAQRTIDLLARSPGLDDDEIANALDPGLAPPWTPAAEWQEADTFRSLGYCRLVSQEATSAWFRFRPDTPMCELVW
jgi:hypothetical protein